MIKHDGEISLSLRSKLYQLNLKRLIILIINFFIKIGKVIEIYNFCDYDYDYFLFSKSRLRLLFRLPIENVID